MQIVSIDFTNPNSFQVMSSLETEQSIISTELRQNQKAPMASLEQGRAKSNEVVVPISFFKRKGALFHEGTREGEGSARNRHMYTIMEGKKEGINFVCCVG